MIGSETNYSAAVVTDERGETDSPRENSTVTNSVMDWLREHPTATVVSSVILGAAIGWVVKRHN